MKTKPIIYWEIYIGKSDTGRLRFMARKILLVRNKYGITTDRFNLTKMGFSHINSYSEFKKLFPKPYYENT